MLWCVLLLIGGISIGHTVSHARSYADYATLLDASQPVDTPGHPDSRVTSAISFYYLFIY
jgi:hypothetical protein